MFGVATTQVDQNLMVMQIATEVCAKYNLECLMHEKPFMGVNGSGKHNNWSLSTTDGINLLNAGQVRPCASARLGVGGWREERGREGRRREGERGV